MEITCVSDLHGYYPELPGGDLLIVAGDLTAREEPKEYLKFHEWIIKQVYKKVILIAGNHDNRLDFFSGPSVSEEWFEYLYDSGTEFEGLKIWGSPWTKKFPGMNPHCMAFTCDTEEELAEKWAIIPDDTNILITHSPSWGLNDRNIYGENCGSKSLTRWIANHVYSLKLFVCGHIHESYGIYDIRKLQDHFDDIHTPIHVNASHVNERYEPVNKPVRIIL